MLGTEKPKPAVPFRFNVAEGLVLMLYPDASPHNLETAELQKGLVLMLEGKEAVEEGVGFGVPVAMYKDGPHFSKMPHAMLQNHPAAKWLLSKSSRSILYQGSAGGEEPCQAGSYTTSLKRFS